MFGKAAALAVLAAVGMAGSAHAQSLQPVGPWDGSNPFRCENQDVGTGTDFPHPNADPFCVEFDKTNQNITDFGIVDFLSQEPTRTAQAVNKCFYFQKDHWTGSVVQGSGPELWHWDGDYFFDKAKGIGGVSVHNFRVGGQPVDFTPYVPAAYQPYVYPGGGGGVIVLLETDPDPQCTALVDTPQERARVYRSSHTPRECVTPGGRIHGRRVGHVKLGETRKRLRKAIGPPKRSRHGVDRWCVIGGAKLKVAYGGRRHRSRLALTSAKGQSLKGVSPGQRAGVARQKLRTSTSTRVGKTKVIRAMRTRHRVGLVGLRHGRVAWVGLGRRGHGLPSALRHTLHP